MNARKSINRLSSQRTSRNRRPNNPMMKSFDSESSKFEESDSSGSYEFKNALDDEDDQGYR